MCVGLALGAGVGGVGAEDTGAGVGTVSPHLTSVVGSVHLQVPPLYEIPDPSGQQ